MARKPWQWAVLGCLVLPVSLPFSLPGVCRSPRSQPEPAVVPQRRAPQRVIYPAPTQRRESVRVIRPAQSQPQQQPIAATNLSAMESQVQAQINQIRRSNGLSALSGNGRLAQVARGHSQNMASRSFFSHTDPNGNTSFERVQGAGIPFQLVAENLAWHENSPNPVSSAVRGWMASPTHRTNIMRPEVNQTGVGITRVGNRYYFTQLFIQN
ncbi:MAG: CAP domain-containing protein [Thermosynechococcaceae cyanobacterium]